MQGDLMIRERRGMEKLYVLPEQLLPDGLDLREPSAGDMAAYLLDNTVRAHGVVSRSKWSICDYISYWSQVVSPR
jgi:uncharacterized protein YcaQ